MRRGRDERRGTRGERRTARRTSLGRGFSIVCALLLVTTPLLAADHSLPLVEERVDAIALIHTAESESVRVVFIRHGRILAERWLSDEMRWLHLSDDPGSFALAWTDFGVAERVVRFQTVSILVFERDPLADDGGPWWGWNRRMTDLKAPP